MRFYYFMSGRGDMPFDGPGLRRICNLDIGEEFAVRVGQANDMAINSKGEQDCGAITVIISLVIFTGS